MKLTKLICFLILIPFGLFGQWREIQLEHLGPNDGLQMGVSAFTEGHDGMLYFGGTQGLIQYNSSDFKLFGHDPDDPTSIGPGEIYNLLTGKDSSIWIALRYGGLNKFDPKTATFSRYPLPKLPYFMIPTVNGLLEDEDYGLWVGGHHFQLLLFNAENNSFTSFQPKWINPEKFGGRLAITSIIQDKLDSNILWLSVLDYYQKERRGHGVVSFNKKTKLFTKHNNSGRILWQNDEGTLYGTRLLNKISSYNPEKNSTHHISFRSHNQLDFISRDILPRNDHFLITTSNAIVKLKQNSEINILHSIPDNDGDEYNSMWSDKDENIWIGKRTGISIIDKKRQHIRFHSLDKFGVFSRIYPGRIAYDENSDVVYLSQNSLVAADKIFRIPLSEDQESTSFSTPHNMKGICMSSTGQLIMAGNGKLSLFSFESTSKSDGTSILQTDHIPWLWNLQSNKKGWVAGAGSENFIWFKDGKFEINKIKPADLESWTALTNYDRKFSGFEFGQKKNDAFIYSSVVYHVDLNSGKTQLLKYDKALNPHGQLLNDVVMDKDGHLWIAGSQFFGQFKIETDSLIILKQYSIKDGISSSEIHELHNDRTGRIWLFTSSGINCISEDYSELKYFGVKAGLPQIYIDPRQIIEKEDGSIITVNRNGLIVFHPDSLWNSTAASHIQVLINNIRINGKNLKYSTEPNYLSEIKIPQNAGVIDIQFQGLAFPKDEGLVYSYRLQNDDTWIDLGKNKLVTLPTLSPGKYQFQVKATSAQGVAPVKSLMILVPKPIYLQLWFILLSIISIIGIIYALIANRIQRIKTREFEKTSINKQIAELELKALRSQMNPHFMFNSLNSIKDFILHAQKEKAAEYLSDFSHLIRLILQNSREKLIPLSQEMETLQLYIDLERLRFDEAFEYDCQIDRGVNLEDVLIPPMLLQPYIENAIWHGILHMKQKGHLSLYIKNGVEHVQCIIDDNGIGRKRSVELKSLSAKKYKSMGMGITQDRIDILNNINALGIRVEIIDKMDAEGNAIGTRVILSIPLSEVLYDQKAN